MHESSRKKLIKKSYSEKRNKASRYLSVWEYESKYFIVESEAEAHILTHYNSCQHYQPAPKSVLGQSPLRVTASTWHIISLFK